MTDLNSEAIELANLICRDVCELPDRSSPDDDPDMLLVTTEELHAICVDHITAALQSSSDVVEIAEGAVRPEVAAFAVLMEQQLRANDHKPGWKRDHAAALLHRIADEYDELSNALRRRADIATDYEPSRGSDPLWGDPEAIATLIGKEAADVANFAMMVADVCGALPTEEVKNAKGSTRRIGSARGVSSPADTIPLDHGRHADALVISPVAAVSAPPSPNPSPTSNGDYVVVPREPTAEMFKAFNSTPDPSFGAAYRNMLAAAPASSAPIAEGLTEAIGELEKYADRRTAQAFSAMQRLANDGDTEGAAALERERDAYSDITMRLRALVRVRA